MFATSNNINKLITIMKHTISQQKGILFLFGELLDCFYSVSISEYDIILQADFSESLIAKLELFGAVFTLKDGDYRATIERLNTKIKFIIQAEEY